MQCRCKNLSNTKPNHLNQKYQYIIYAYIGTYKNLIYRRHLYYTFLTFIYNVQISNKKISELVISEKTTNFVLLIELYILFVTVIFFHYFFPVLFLSGHIYIYTT